MYAVQYDSPVGKLLLTCRDAGLTGIWFDRELPDHCRQENHPILQQTQLWLDGYFSGEKPSMEISLVPEGTEFQKQVWKQLMTIPYGETKTYGEIALEVTSVMGKEKMSAQAVGQAVGRNPISILIPCHRCVGAKGRLTGYAGGMDRKIWLLRHEGRHIENDTVL
jgi:methylated-DNA-[protein]-cysteine S-methyltransferase